MKISVVIPAYNEEKSIGTCLTSLINQEVKPDEIVVVDNNSLDNTVKIATKFGVRVLKERKKGCINARHRGYSEAKYEIMASCDSDSILPSDWIKRIKDDFMSNNIDALTGPIIYYDLPFKNIFYSQLYLDVMNFIQHGETLIGPNMTITKKVWQKIEKKVCDDPNLVFDDIDLSIHIHKVGGKIIRDKNLVVETSGRRIKDNPASFFIKYPIRVMKTFRNH